MRDFFEMILELVGAWITFICVAIAILVTIRLLTWLCSVILLGGL